MTDLEAYKQHVDDKLEIFRLQLGRLTSDWASEKDNRHLLSKRIDDAMQIMHELNTFKTYHHEKLELLDKIIRNGGNGLVMDVDRLKQEKMGNKSRWFIGISIVTIILNLAGFIISLLKSDTL